MTSNAIRTRPDIIERAGASYSWRGEQDTAITTKVVVVRLNCRLKDGFDQIRRSGARGTTCDGRVCNSVQRQVGVERHDRGHQDFVSRNYHWRGLV